MVRLAQAAEYQRDVKRQRREAYVDWTQRQLEEQQRRAAEAVASLTMVDNN
jgi:hypothetical protein